MLLMASAMLSRVIGLVRVKYIAWLLGHSAAADAFNAAFQLPDMLAYLLIGGAVSITLVTILTRYRETGRDAEADHTLSVILTTMTLVLGCAILIAEIEAPLFVHWWFNGFSPDKAALCVLLTRILLPTQLFVFAGGVFASVLITHRIFSVQAVAPPIYVLGIVVGGVLLMHTIGVTSLAIGGLCGAFCGPFLLNAIGAHRVGMRFRPALDWSDPGLREWIRMSIPLMLGFSLVTVDTWIINHFASHVGGAITLLAYAKQMFTAPVSLGQAAGAASLPFLASLYRQADRTPFVNSVNSSVSRIFAFSLLLSTFMIAMAAPLADVLLRGGAFSHTDATTMATYFAIFAVSLGFWTAQAIYSRAFYVAGDTVTPMISATIITALSIPVYSILYRVMGPVGLSIASDIGIFLHTTTLAYLLHRKRLVPFTGFDFSEIGRSLITAPIVLAILFGIVRVTHTSSRLWELVLLVVATLIWLGVSAVVLRLTGSSMPDELMARFLGRTRILSDSLPQGES
jgi:putative peptidoglycan lipid II flippase